LTRCSVFIGEFSLEGFDYSGKEIMVYICPRLRRKKLYKELLWGIFLPPKNIMHYERRLLVDGGTVSRAVM